MARCDVGMLKTAAYASLYYLIESKVEENSIKIIRSDAWNGETGTHALTLKVELMHEAEKQGRQHHFLPLSRSPPAHVGTAPPAKPYPTVGPRQQGVLFPRRAPLPGGPSPLPRRAPTGRRFCRPIQIEI